MATTDAQPLAGRVIPFGMLYRDPVPQSARGYDVYPETWSYDPASQVSDLIRMGGKTEPTTVSTVASTTGFINSDSDSSNDDKGTD